METGRAFWFYLAVLVAVAAMFAWALWSAIGIGPPWISWASVLIFVLALGSVGVRAWIKAKRIVWTEEMKAAQRELNQEQSRRILLLTIPTMVLGLGTWTSINLVQYGVLPQWLGAVLFFALQVAGVWLWLFVRRITA